MSTLPLEENMCGRSPPCRSANLKRRLPWSVTFGQSVLENWFPPMSRLALDILSHTRTSSDLKGMAFFGGLESSYGTSPTRCINRGLWLRARQVACRDGNVQTHFFFCRLGVIPLHSLGFYLQPDCLGRPVLRMRTTMFTVWQPARVSHFRLGCQELAPQTKI